MLRCVLSIFRMAQVVVGFRVKAAEASAHSGQYQLSLNFRVLSNAVCPVVAFPSLLAGERLCGCVCIRCHGELGAWLGWLWAGVLGFVI